MSSTFRTPLQVKKQNLGGQNQAPGDQLARSPSPVPIHQPLSGRRRLACPLHCRDNPSALCSLPKHENTANPI